MTKYNVGDLVYYKRGWMARYTNSSVVVSVERYKDAVIYVMQDGHWAFEGQVVGTIKEGVG